MPTFEFTSPDGKTYEIEGPEGATEAEAFQILQGQLGEAPATPAGSPEEIAAQSEQLLAEGLPTAEATGLEPIVIPEARPEPTLGEQAIGAGEAALTLGTGATGGLVGSIGGTLKGLAEQILSGEFGTQEAANLVQQESQKGAQALTYAPRTQAGQEQVGAVAEALSSIPPVIPVAAPLGAAVAGVAPVARQLAGQTASNIQKMMKFQTPAKKKILEKIKADPQSTEVVKYIEKGSGTIGKDKDAIEAIKQGFDEGIVAAVKGSSDSDKGNMKKMINIMKAGRKNVLFGTTNRPSDIAGNSLVRLVNVVKTENRKAGKAIERAANKLKGVDVDFKPAMDNFMSNLDEAGVTLGRNDKGRLVPNFIGSDFEGVKGAETIINNVIKRLDATKAPDAYGIHRAKKFIDEQVSYGRAKEGLTGSSERIVKKLRADLDGALDSNFDNYRIANEGYAKTRRGLDDLQKSAGSSVDLFGANADKALGTVLRRVLSNTQSRVKLIDSIDDIQSIVKGTGKKVDGNITAQLLFADELDRMFKTTARTSLAGQTEQAVAKGLKTRGLTEVAIDAAGKLAEKARGINDENAIKVIEKILERRGK